MFYGHFSLITYSILLRIECKQSTLSDTTMEHETLTVPLIGDAAPAFKAATTQGDINFPQDFKGKWVILFSHPSDFTPVCTSEFMAFGKMAGEFEELNCQLIGLSIDSISSHIAWLRTIREKIEYKGMKNMDIGFPVIEDLSMQVARAFGMLQPNESLTKTIRSVFFIDPEGIIRAIIYYPMALGRNFDEIKRVLTGLQVIDRFGVALPADWQPGDDVIDPNPSTMKKVQERIDHHGQQVKVHDWFLVTKPLSKEEIKKGIQ